MPSLVRQSVCSWGTECGGRAGRHGLRRAIGTFLSLSAKTRILQTQISTNRPPFVMWGIWRFSQSLFGPGNIYTSIKYRSMRYAHELHAYEVHAREVQAHEVQAHEVHAREVHAREVHAHEVHAREVHAYEVHADQVKAHEVQAVDLPAHEIIARKEHGDGRS